jgi:hypothetical protein
LEVELRKALLRKELRDYDCLKRSEHDFCDPKFGTVPRLRALTGQCPKFGRSERGVSKNYRENKGGLVLASVGCGRILGFSDAFCARAVPKLRFWDVRA